MKRFVMAFLFASVVVVFIFVSFCSPRQEPFQLGSGPYLGYQPFYLGDDQLLCKSCPPTTKFIGGNPYQWNVLPSTLSAIRLFQAGELDGIVLTLDTAVVFQQQTTVAVCIAEILSQSKNGDGLLVGEKFDPTQPIVIGYEQTPFGTYMLSHAAATLGWQPELIEVRYIVPKHHVAALLNEEVNALITYEPYITELLAHNTHVVFSGNDMPAKTLDVMVVTRSAYEKQEKLITWLTNDFWYAGVRALQAGGPKVLLKLEEHTGVANIDLENALAGIRFFDQESRSEVTEAHLNELVTYFTKSKGIAVNGQVLQRCDSTQGER